MIEILSNGFRVGPVKVLFSKDGIRLSLKNALGLPFRIKNKNFHIGKERVSFTFKYGMLKKMRIHDRKPESENELGEFEQLSYFHEEDYQYNDNFLDSKKVHIRSLLFGLCLALSAVIISVNWLYYRMEMSKILIAGLVGLTISIAIGWLDMRIQRTRILKMFQKDELDMSKLTITKSKRSKWLIHGMGTVMEPKKNHGLKHKYLRKRIAFNSRGNSILSLKNDAFQMLCLSDGFFIYDDNRYYPFRYCEGSVEFHEMEYLEEKKTNDDNEILRYVWKYVKNDGEIDKRYKKNKPLPIVKYGVLMVKINEILQLKILFNSVLEALEFENWLVERGMTSNTANLPFLEK